MIDNSRSRHNLVMMGVYCYTPEYVACGCTAFFFFFVFYKYFLSTHMFWLFLGSNCRDAFSFYVIRNEWVLLLLYTIAHSSSVSNVRRLFLPVERLSLLLFLLWGGGIYCAARTTHVFFLVTCALILELAGVRLPDQTLFIGWVLLFVIHYSA